MRISSFTVYGYGNGSIIVEISDTDSMSIGLTDAEANELRAVAQRIVERRQASLLEAVNQPFIALANFSEA